MGTSSAAAASRASCRAARRAGPASFIVHVPFAAAASCASVFRFGAIEKANDLRQMGHRARISTSEGRMTRAAGAHAMPDQRHKSTAGTLQRQWWNVNDRASGWQQSQAASAWRMPRSRHDIPHLASLGSGCSEEAALMAPRFIYESLTPASALGGGTYFTRVNVLPHPRGDPFGGR